MWFALLQACAVPDLAELGDREDRLMFGVGDSGLGPSTFVPVAVGFEFDGLIDSDGSVGEYTSAGYTFLPSMSLKVAGEDFFALGDVGATCMFITKPYQPPRARCDLPNDDGVAVFDSYESVLTIDYTDCGNKLDPAVYNALLAAFDGMRLGIAFGPMTPYLAGAWDNLTLQDYGDAMTAMYVSIVHPDGSFLGSDWSTAISWQVDPSSAEVLADPNGYLVKEVPPHDGRTMNRAYVRTFAYWYEDFPLLDFQMLDDPTGPTCTCAPPDGDLDGDGICNSADRCPQDDPDDTDGDGVCDSDDPCPDDPTDDRDGDGACDSDDPCPRDPADDTDGDGACDSDDPCPQDDPDDTDGDGACDSDDPCPADADDDTDGDGLCDADDPCPEDVGNDTDGDGVCDADDPCPLDDPDDRDSDGACDSDDACPDDPRNDHDHDGACAGDDPCPDDANDDGDGDGSCDSDDPCPADPTDDPDGDGACGSTGGGGDGDGDADTSGGCDTAPRGPAAWLALLPLLAVRRRSPLSS